MRILVPGRWQPLHVGHEQHIKRLSRYGNLVIGIRDSEPFSLAERQEMIKLIFPRLEIVYLPENKFYLWQQMAGTDIVATSNTELGLSLIKDGITTLLAPRANAISGTEIRDRLGRKQPITGLVNPKIEGLILEMWANKIESAEE